MFLRRNKKRKDERVLCFGSTRGRFHGIRRERSFPGPFEHSCETSVLKKFPNKSGYTLLASKSPRLKDRDSGVPPVGAYNVDPFKPQKPSARPFGLGQKLEHKIKWSTPGPGSHSIFKREVKVCEAFGHGPRVIVPLALIKCEQYNMSQCFKCEESPVGDFWHKASTKQDMCRSCMKEEWKKLKKCSTSVLVRHRMKRELQTYHLMRNCAFYHDHNSTKAAVQFMPRRDLIRKLRTENYLGSYGF